MLRSRALEITVESCVTSPLTSEQTNSLQQLLSTFIPSADPSALASSIARLAQLLSEDTQSFDTTGMYWLVMLHHLLHTKLHTTSPPPKQAMSCSLQLSTDVTTSPTKRVGERPFAGAAQRAVHNVISSLKSAKAGSEPAAKPVTLQDRLSVIDREASKQQGFLASVEKLSSNDPLKPRMPGQGSGISK